MPTKDFIPSGDADLLLWAQANSAFITGTPTAYGLTAAIATAYAGYVTTFAAKLAAARAENRGRVDIIQKDAARDALVEYARSWARLVQGQMSITTAQRAQLGLNLRENPGTPIHPPSTPPVVTVVEAIGRTLKVKVRGVDAAGRRKPVGAQGVTIFTYLGPTPSADPRDWSVEGQSTRGDFDIQLGADTPAGSCVWISAAWYSPRGVYSVLSNPISAYVAGGIAATEAEAAATTTTADGPTLKAA